MKKIFIPLLLVLSFSFNLVAQNTLYVSPGGSNTSPYSSLATAAINIQTAVDAATAGDLILVNDGVYTLTANVSVTQGITIKSINGYPAVTINGNNVTRCFYVNSSGAVIDGFTITNGRNLSGYGGGVQCDNGVIKNCLIENCASRDGGGVALDNSGMVFNSIIRNNSADWGGGVRCFGNSTVRGCLITGNTATPHGGGVNIWSGGTIQNCTIVNNSATDGAGIRLWNNGIVENSVIYSNTGSNNYIIDAGHGNSITYSCTTPLVTGTGNISDAPLFVNESGGDYHLTGSSTLIDAGLNSTWMNTSFDLEGHNRILDSKVDMGAFEFKKIIIDGPTPIASWPMGNTTEYNNPPTLYWYITSYAAGLSYQIQCVPVADPSWPNDDTYFTASAMSYTFTSGLTAGVKYAWRVRSTNGTSRSNWSAPALFTMVANTVVTPVIPVASWPAGNPTEYNNPPTLNWYITTYAPGLSYEIQCVPASNPSWPDDNSFYTSSTMSYTLTANLSAGVQYAWRVRSVTGTVKSAWSIPALFTMDANNTSEPIMPIASWPVGNATEYINPPTLNWYITTYVPGLTYEIQCVPSSDPEWPDENSVTASSNISCTLSSGLISGIQYAWRVRSVLGAIKSDWSTPALFTMASTNTAGPVVPIPSWPAGNTTEYTNPPTLSWYLASLAPEGLSYELQCVPASDPNWPGDNSFSTSLNMYYTLTTNLTSGVQYAWRVRSVLGTAKSVWSTPARFTMVANNSLVQPVAGSPANSATINAVSTRLFWYLPTASAVDQSYEVEIADNQNFRSAKKFSSANSNLQVDGLEGGKDYFWKVRSTDARGNASYYSGIGQFKVNNLVTSVEALNAIPASFELSQNFPNPFNPTTKISYALPSNAFVSIRIYDMLGREVKALVNREMNAGNHSVEWNGENGAGIKVASGAYIYRIDAGSFISTKKMIMLK